MKICYLVLTCEKYFNTRVKWQKQTVFKNTDMNDIYYISHKMDIENRVYGFQTPDDYINLPKKYFSFIKNINLLDKGYDWFVLMDDDTYLFIDKLETLLSAYNSTQPYEENIWIGNYLKHISEWFIMYMSGGAGSVMSYKLYKNVYELLQNYSNIEELNPIFRPIQYPSDPMDNADICVGCWVNHSCKLRNEDVKIVDNPNFNTGKCESIEEYLNSFKKAITFHKLNEEKDYLPYIRF